MDQYINKFSIKEYCICSECQAKPKRFCIFPMKYSSAFLSMFKMFNLRIHF